MVFHTGFFICCISFVIWYNLQMSYFVEYSPISFADLEKLTQTAQDRITKKLIGWLIILTKSYLKH